jgi:2,3-bisphosphoglycerate-dependent phosphoglycerate mutase
MLNVLLLRHATPVLPGTPGFDEHTRPLTPDGTLAALALSEQLRSRRIEAVYSSPYRRAIATVEPLARARQLDVHAIDDLREHLLTPEPVAHWRELLTLAWQDLEAAPGGAESLRSTQARGLAVLERLRQRHSGQTIAVGGHGTIFACILHAHVPTIDCAFHIAMPMPALYELEHDGSRWRVLTGPGI